jgi:uncharacterized protein
MSQENVEVSRRSADAFNRRDLSTTQRRGGPRPGPPFSCCGWPFPASHTLRRPAAQLWDAGYCNNVEPAAQVGRFRKLLPNPATSGLRDTALAMSQENVEVLRRWYEAANRRELEAAVEYLAPELEFQTAGIFPDMDAVYRGREAFVSFLYEFAEPWEELSIEPDRYLDIGVRVLVLAHFKARGRDGIEVERPFAHLWTMRDGRAVRLVAYADQKMALEAVGRSEGVG